VHITLYTARALTENNQIENLAAVVLNAENQSNIQSRKANI
jgi:hypothetical protein